ncbi:hypothetical protein ACC776_37440, partial [Rhizobium johnstonii]
TIPGCLRPQGFPRESSSRGNRENRRQRYCVVVRERVELVPEQPVKLSFETAKVQFFDRQTQKRLNA